MPTSGNVLALLPVLTPYTPTSAQFDLLYPYALDEFEGDDPGAVRPAPNGRSPISWRTTSLAGRGRSGSRREDRRLLVHLAGAAAATSRWYVMYRQQLDRCRDALAIGPAALAGVQHADVSGLSDLHLDQNPVVRVRRDSDESP
jgi:hypothetical protein